MTDINLKTLTPDTSLPTTGFLFGADSQASTNPSVYSTQTVATTLLGSTSLTGDTLTASAPVLNLAQTWNNVATTFTGMKFNVVSDTSAAASLLMDLQVVGTSKFKVAKSGTVTVASGSATVGAQAITFADDPNAGIYAGSNQLYFTGNGVNFSQQLFVNNFINMTNDTGALRLGSAYDISLTRKGAANLRFGAADAAAPVAQTLSVQSVVAGATTNPAGADFTITGSQGLGSGAGGSIIFKVAPAGTAGNPAQNALQTALTINSLGVANFATSKTGNSDTAVFLAPNMGVGNTTFMSLGKATSIKDMASFGFYYAGASSSSNAFTLAFSSTGNIWGLTADTTNTLMFLGGQTSSFPALKRSSTTLQARLADDSAFASVQGKLTTDTAYTAGVLVPTGYITLYDSTGTAYRVPCLV
jgi:hypothetical protein